MDPLSFVQIRRTARVVAERAPHVRIDLARIAAIAARYAPPDAPAPGSEPGAAVPEQQRVAFLLVLGALRFGSGYEPRLRDSDGVGPAPDAEARLAEHFARHGPFSAARLAALTPAETAALLGQQFEDPAQTEFIELQARSLRDLGRLVLERFEGSFGALADAAAGSAARFVGLLATTPYFHDVQRYRGLEVPFFHRAQRVVLDFAQGFGGRGPGRFTDLRDLAPSSDASMAHALRGAGALVYEGPLAQRVDQGELVPAHSEREVELRASALHAVDRIVAAVQSRGLVTAPHLVDAWLRAGARAEAATDRPSHRTRTVFY